MKSESQQSQTPLEQKLAQVKLKPAKDLTVPLYSMAHLKALTIQVKGEPYKAVDIPGLQKDNKGVPTVLPVLNMDTDENGLLIMNAIIESAFSKVEGGIVGKYFMLRSGDIRDGKKYRDIKVTLMEVDK